MLKANLFDLEANIIINGILLDEGSNQRQRNGKSNHRWCHGIIFQATFMYINHI
jgi:hypothetical protein